MRFAILCGLVFCCLPASFTNAADPPGLEVGKKAPDFILNDQSGKKQQLSKLLEGGPVAVVFHRSANW